ncbi:MAG: DUF4876 domain-containing protein [Candidatus Marinimicrobia bacterium]|nr:DUF4876 domain-containing protein [Candidatus Neomarinimicrobiota bacterium]
MKQMLVLLVVVFLIMSCEETAAPDLASFPGISIISPDDNAMVSDSVKILYQISNVSDVKSIELVVDNHVVPSTYSILNGIVIWYSALVKNGTRCSVYLRCRDQSDRVLESNVIRLIIDKTEDYPDAVEIVSVDYRRPCFEIVWRSSSDSGFAAYRLEHSSKKDFSEFESVYVTDKVLDTVYTDCEINRLNYQYYRVWVVDSTGLETVSEIKRGNPFLTGLQINEIYSCGPANNFFFFYDQYIELYNSAEDTLYLDGVIVCRMGKSIEDVTYIFQFPGEPLIGREYPVAPDSFVVLAMDAYNYRDEIFSGERSIDLSIANWEFVNPNDPGDNSNNPDVPNILNIEEGHTLDFMYGLAGDVLLIADGSDVYYQDGIDISTVIDCVEYSSDPAHVKEMPYELDIGYAGLGLVKYSGNSLERKMPGMDTNNSSVDFEVIAEPTVGFGHISENSTTNGIR